MADDGALPAGNFSSWLDDMQGAIRGERAANVPCGSCTACCTSSQFVHIGPDEADTLAHVPPELLFPAPGWPPRHVVLGYDEHGHCPMLVDGRCSIYEHRPTTCRTYDCRVFAATGIDIDDKSKVEIADRARQWRFSYPTTDDRLRQNAVRAAAAFVHAREEARSEATRRRSATERAVLAVRMHEAFLRQAAQTDPD